MKSLRLWAAIALVGGMALPLAQAADGDKGHLLGAYQGTFYKDWPLFSTRPDETKSSHGIGRFGPVGIAIEIYQPAFQMRIKGIEKGSPAEATGKLKPGLVIETINGQKLADIDPRVQLGGIITAAEATDGKVRLMVKEKPEAPAEEVVVEIPVLGAYSTTWPLDCPKSDRIVRNMADYLAKTGNHAGPGTDLGLLFMLSTGDEKDLEVARGWVREVVEKTKDSPQIRTYPWYAGYGGLGLAEYYLRTGDETVLPLIGKLAESLKRDMYNGGWNSRGGVQFAYGHINAAGVPALAFLLLARQCGAAVDEHTLQESLRHFYRFAGHGNVAYGDGLPEAQFVDNGKTGKLAFAMAAAAALTPDGERSVYAKARDISAIKGFYSTSWMLHGHTGGGIGEIWRSASMGLMAEKKPTKFREFMDNRMWHYEMSRRFDGSFGILGGERYDDPGNWGIGYALTYTIPRKTLRMTGAPPTKFCKPCTLPERPWGTPADEVFSSLAPAPDKVGRLQDVDAEKLATDASWPILRRVNDPAVSDDVLLMYARHPDHGVRELAAGAIYAQKRDHLVLELLRDEDPRPRHAATMVIANYAPTKRKTVDESGRLTDEMLTCLFDIIDAPNESWWLVRGALVAVGVAQADALVPHVDRLCEWLQHDEWWLRQAAVTALAKVMTDERCYEKVLPLIGQTVKNNRIYGMQWPLWGLAGALKSAAPEVQSLGLKVFGEAYGEFPATLSVPSGVDMRDAQSTLLNGVAMSLAEIPGGYDALYDSARKRFPNEPLPYADSIFLKADVARFGPGLQKAVAEIARTQLIYEYMGRNRVGLLTEAGPVQQASRNMFSKLGGLVALYDKAGIHDYDWHAFGPDLRNGTWDYFTFDPPEQLATDLGGWRYRKVTLPAGMENWFEPGFDAAAAGWRKGQSPFGQKGGKLMKENMAYDSPDCRCGEHDPMHTLWDKEVLLMRGTFQFPPLQPGHAYRILIGAGSHVGSGSGFCLYLNGKKLTEEQHGVSKRESGTLRGAAITEDLRAEFAKGPVTIAATSFLRYQDHLKPPATPPVPQGIFSVWVEEMKLPPLDDASFRTSATVIPMLSSAWQARQDPDHPAADPRDGTFRYDGTFAANPKLPGDWKAVAVVPEIAAFDPAKPGSAGNAIFKEITFKDGGLTGSPTLIWSADTLMDLSRFEALTVVPRTIEGADYLFIEAGGFSGNHKPGWKSQLVVLKRAEPSAGR